jgi:hypothetical protein
MTSQVLHQYPEGARLSHWIIVGFVSGAAAVLVFHQGAAALLHALELTARAPYSMQLTSPWGVPQLWSITFWGGRWGALLAATLARLEGACSWARWYSERSFRRSSRGSSSLRSKANRWRAALCRWPWLRRSS